MPKLQKKRSKNLLKSIPIMAVVFAVLVPFGNVNPDVLQAAFGYKIVVWFYMTCAWSACMLFLYYTTKDVGKTNAEIESGD